MQLAALDPSDPFLDFGPGALGLGEPRRVLVADPDTDVRRLVAASFDDDGWRVSEVSDANGLAGALLFDRSSPGYSLVVTAQRMPDGSGLDVLATLFEAGRGVPFILLADTPEPALAERARRIGAVAVLARLFSPWILQKHARSIDA